MESISTQEEAYVGMENGGTLLKGSGKEVPPGRTAHNISSSSLRKKSDLHSISKIRFGLLKNILSNLQEVILGTKLAILFPAVPLAIFAHVYGLGRAPMTKEAKEVKEGDMIVLSKRTHFMKVRQV